MMKFHQGKYSMEEIKIIAIHVIKKYYKKKNLNEMIITEKKGAQYSRRVQERSPSRSTYSFSILIYRRRLASRTIQFKRVCFLASSWALPLEGTSRRMREKRSRFFFLGPLCGIILGWLGPFD